MKNLLVSVLAFTPGLCWSMTEQQSIDNWKAACVDAYGEYDVDFIKEFNDTKSLHIVYTCERVDGSQTVRIVPAGHLVSDERS